MPWDTSGDVLKVAILTEIIDMNGFELLKKIKPRGVQLDKITPPPPSSVYLMAFIAVIGIVNLKAMLPSLPNQILISPILIVMIFGPFYKRYHYIFMMGLVDLGWYVFGNNVFIFPEDEILFTVVATNLVAIGTIEVARFFWKEVNRTTAHLTRMNDFLDELDFTLSSLSYSYVLKDGVIEVLRLVTNRFFLSGAYLFQVKGKEHPMAVFHSKYEDPSSIYEHELLFTENLNEGDIDISRLLAELSHKDILISSATSNTSIGKKLRKKYHLKSLVFIAMHSEEEIIGFLTLVEYVDSLNINSLDYRIISIIRSSLEIALKSEDQKIVNKRLERTNYEFTKIALADTKTIMNKCKDS